MGAMKDRRFTVPAGTAGCRLACGSGTVYFGVHCSSAVACLLICFSRSLAEKASSDAVDTGGAVLFTGTWLHGVAVRLALFAWLFCEEETEKCGLASCVCCSVVSHPQCLVLVARRSSLRSFDSSPVKNRTERTGSSWELFFLFIVIRTRCFVINGRDVFS